MAINFKKILSESLLRLCIEKPLESITVQQLLDDTGISRQTFYNHFRDKNDLIQYIYETKIIADFQNPTEMEHFEASMVKVFEQMKKYQTFMVQACKMEGQNSLKEYIFTHCQEFDLKWHEQLFGSELTEELKFATIYHATASSSMTLSWILSGMIVDSKQMARMITEMRAVGMDVLFKDKNKNPYN